ncbi:cytoplasmic protein [Pseudomonas sp. HMWF010]|nr:cytoplasmic protein [Caulobacter sp. HMWF009]PTT09844.1 cytoplasmic protein [Caulobacter sp. HMWF025]PTT78431.1 cytoplasmic protein [Pseudomonas sp. HMWF010]
MTFTRKVLDEAHRHSRNHAQELEESDLCGCFYCCRTFIPTAIEEWADDEHAIACCPLCGIDSVLGAASGFPVSDPKFLKAMASRWFG